MRTNVILLALVAVATVLPAGLTGRVADAQTATENNPQFGMGPLRTDLLSPLQKKVDANASRIEAIDARLAAVEKRETELLERIADGLSEISDKLETQARPAKPALPVSVAAAKSRPEIGSHGGGDSFASVATARVTNVAASNVSASNVSASGARRLKTTSELAADIAAARSQPGYFVGKYGRMARGSEGQVYAHLVATHGYTSGQVRGLSLRDATVLHDLAHGPRISAYTKPSGTLVRRVSRQVSQPVAEPVQIFNPTPNNGNRPAPPPPQPGPRYNNCPNGRCPLVGASRGSASRASRWRPGKLLFGW